MILRAVIIDDEQKGIDALAILIKRFISGLKVISYALSADSGMEMIENYKPDVVFLDINMPNTNGFELLERVKWKEFNLIFTTAHEEHALKALKNNAMDYLLKPIDHEDLRMAINRIKHKIASSELSIPTVNYYSLLSAFEANAKNRIAIHSKHGIESLYEDDIVYFEAMANYTKICLSGSNEIFTSKSLKEFEMQLCIGNEGFMRIHNSYIINLRKIKRYLKGDELIMMEVDHVVPLSKSRKDTFLKWLGI